MVMVENDFLEISDFKVWVTKAKQQFIFTMLWFVQIKAL